MITIILSLIIINFFVAKLSIYLILRICKKACENPLETMTFVTPEIFEWVRYINANPSFVIKSSFFHLPIINLFICFFLLITFYFIQIKN